MKFHRLRVTHYKGVDNIEIAFAPTGITLIQGPNEAGKSSLVQAVTTLFDEPVSRQRSTLAHLIPKDGRGVPDILLEAETGGYRFTYRKRFVERRLTELTVHSDGDASYSGGEARDRVAAILAETLDLSLWRALMLQQGLAIGLPEVRDQGALMNVLDRSVTGSSASRNADSLFRKVEEEYRRFYNTGSGAELQELAGLRRSAAEAEAGAKEYERLLEDLEKKTGRAKRLREDLRALRNTMTREEGLLAKSRDRLAEIVRMEKVLEAESGKRERAGRNRLLALRERDERSALLQSGEEERQRAAKARKEAEAAAAAETELAAVSLDKKQRHDALDAERIRLEALLALRRDDCGRLAEAAELARLRERKTWFDASRKARADAEAELAGNPVTEEAEKEIRDAERRAELARAALGGAAPELRVDALADCAVRLDNAGLSLAKGETRRIPVAEAARLEVPDLLAVTVLAGRDAGAFREELRQAEEGLRSVLARHGVPDAADAPVLRERRREAEQALAEHDRALREHLRDLNLDDADAGLAERTRRLEASLAAHAGRRPASPPPAGDAETARELRDAAEQAWGEATERCEAARLEWRAAEAARQEARDARVRREAEREAAMAAAERTRRLAAEFAARASVEELDEAVRKAEADFSAAAAAAAVVETELREAGPAEVRERHEFLERTLRDNALAERKTREELAGLEGELRQQGGEGLEERLAEARNLFEYESRRLAAALRRAEAAKLLYRTVAAAREQSRKAYILPLKNRIEELARSVYDRPVTVRLDDELRIVSRAMDGMEVEFPHLSGGAREQFSLIHRAACGMLVSDDGGVPLILDDALGYSDQERLYGMNLVLERAARNCQIVILTCMPERYRHLRPARTINLEKGGEAT